jgi:hypothetical protein
MHRQCILQTYTVPVVDCKNFFNIIIRTNLCDHSEERCVLRQLINVIESITIEKDGWIQVRVNSQKI